MIEPVIHNKTFNTQLILTKFIAGFLVVKKSNADHIPLFIDHHCIYFKGRVDYDPPPPPPVFVQKNLIAVLKTNID